MQMHPRPNERSPLTTRWRWARRSDATSTVALGLLCQLLGRELCTRYSVLSLSTMAIRFSPYNMIVAHPSVAPRGLGAWANEPTVLVEIASTRKYIRVPNRQCTPGYRALPGIELARWLSPLLAIDEHMRTRGAVLGAEMRLELALHVLGLESDPKKSDVREVKHVCVPSTLDQNRKTHKKSEVRFPIESRRAGPLGSQWR